MLCRTAYDLYWVARHMERAENTARLLDMAQRIALLPERLDRGKAAAAAWRRALDSLGIVESFIAEGRTLDAGGVVQHLLLSPENPNSIFNCIRIARENARAQRVAITGEMYEDLNASWLEVRRFDAQRLRHDGLSTTLEWVKTRSASFRGITIGTLGRGEGYHFLQMGAFIERADWSIRLLDMIGSDAELPQMPPVPTAPSMKTEATIALPNPVRIERSRDAPRRGARSMGVSTALDTNGKGRFRLNVSVSMCRL